MEPTQELLTLYLQNPCGTLPNAFWKTAANLGNTQLLTQKGLSGDLASFALWEENRLMAFWCADPQHHPLTSRQIEETPFVLVHADALSVFDKRDFALREPYFRIIHRGTPQAPTCPEGFVFENVEPQLEVESVVHLIHACYRNIKITDEIVQGWLQHPVYDPHLWVWVVDVFSGTRVGLGIAEVDHQVSEASLEWVQVLPKYQKSGLGTALVRELLCRISENVDFVTVSGKQDNLAKAENLYRRCGFIGSDIWYLLSV